MVSVIYVRTKGLAESRTSMSKTFQTLCALCLNAHVEYYSMLQEELYGNWDYFLPRCKEVSFQRYQANGLDISTVVE